MAQLNIAGWSSSVARRAHNPKVVGSNPAPATKQLYDKFYFGAYHSIKQSVQF